MLSKDGSKLNLLLMLLALAPLAGCTSVHQYVHNGFKVGPNYSPPEAPVAEHWIDAGDKRVSTASEDQSQWWTVFNDPTLNELVADAYRQNLDIREAGFRILRARAVLGITVGELFPGNDAAQVTPGSPGGFVLSERQQATGSYTHQMLSKSRAFGIDAPQRPLDTWSYGLTAPWELDFWGRFRRAVDQKQAELDQTVEAYDAALVTMLYSTAQNYIEVRKCQQAMASLRGTIKAQQKVLADSVAKEEAGTATVQDTAQARSNLARTEALILNYEKDLRGFSNALCILLGMPPQDLSSRLGTGAIPTAPSEVTVGIPAELLSRRPDVRAAEREAAAYAEQVGIAQAEFYPFIGITGSIGYQANEFRDLWNSTAFTGSIGPTFRWNVLNYGRTVNWVRNWDAQAHEKVVTYQRQVLSASLEVENAMKDFLLSQQIVKQREISVSSLKTAHDIALTKYIAGVQTYTPVSLIFQDYVTELVALYQSRRDVADSLMHIYAALGGGWQIRLQPAETLPVTPDRAPAGTPQPAEELPTPDAEMLQPPADLEPPAAKPKPAAKAAVEDTP